MKNILLFQSVKLSDFFAILVKMNNLNKNRLLKLFLSLEISGPSE